MKLLLRLSWEIARIDPHDVHWILWIVSALSTRRRERISGARERVGALRCPPVGVDLGERSPVIFVSSDWPDFHRMLPSELRYGQSVDAIVRGMGPDELYEGHLSAENRKRPPNGSLLQRHRTVTSFRRFHLSTAVTDRMIRIVRD